MGAEDIRRYAANELAGVREAAQILGVQVSTLRGMRHRGKMPAPIIADLNGAPVWAVDDLLATKPNTKSKKTLRKISYPVDESLPPVVDLFAGCGGLSLGFQEAGFKVEAGFDFWDKAVETYSRNLDHPAFQLDLSDVEKSIEVLTPYFVDSAQGIIGGPPCQDFSSAGKRVEGARADLTERFAEIVIRIRPRFFVMENVPRAIHAAAYQRALSAMRSVGYGLTVKTMNAAYCGVPQLRKRLFAVGVMGANDDFLNEALESGLSENPMSLRDAFGDEFGIDHYYRHPRSYARRGIFSIDEPSPTVRGVNRPVPQGYPGHAGDTAPIDGIRPLTTTERSRIQTFPEGYVWPEAKTNAEQMIGNAVPVKLAAYVACALSSHLKSAEIRLEQQILV